MNFPTRANAIQSTVRAHPLVVSFLAGTLLCVYLIGRIVFSGFSILDDHDLIAWTGHDLWSRILSTELGQYGYGIRCRAVMYLTMIGESFLFGNNPQPYHILQVLRFAVFLWAFAWAGMRSLGVVAGLLLLLFLGNEHYWINIWANSLFNSEQSASLGLGLVIFGCGLISSWFVAGSQGKVDRGLVLVSVGALVCVGSKENFLPMIPLNIAFVVLAWRRMAVKPSTIVFSICLILAQLAICYGIVVPNMAQVKGDSELGLAARIADIFHVKRFALRIYLAWSGSAIAAGMAIFGTRDRPPEKARAFMVLAALLGWSGIYLCWEQFFYHGLLPTGYRYDFPSYLIDPILLGAAFYGAVQARDRFAWFGNEVSSPMLQLFLLQIILVMILWPAVRLSVDPGRLFQVHYAMRSTTDRTTAMIRDLDRARQLAAQHPTWPIILRTRRPAEYEGVLSFPVWLHWYKISNPASIEYRFSPGDIHMSTEQSQAEGIAQASVAGVAGLYVARDSSIALAEDQGQCYISQAFDEPTRCIQLPFNPSNYPPATE